MQNKLNSHKTPEINQLSNEEAKWFAIYTKFKCEKYVANHLAKKNIEAYLPLIRKTRRYQRKVKHYDVPLIHCYVFVRIKKSDYIRTLETEYVMKFLRQGNDLIAIPEEEIDKLKRVSGDVDESFETESVEYQFGETVEVVSGHLTGMKGKIVSKAGKKSFAVELETIGYHLLINIDLSMLRPVQKMKRIA
jgi:transcription antitermination factor NusG